MSKSYVTCTIEENIAVITIDKPPVNALNPVVTQELSSIFDRLSVNSDVKAAVLAAKGKAFVAGAEIKSFPALNRKTGEAFALAVTEMHQKIEEFEWPVIAAINGFALGGGCELAMTCDIRIASSNAKFGLPEVTLGLIPGAGGTQRLPRLIPIGKAKMMVFSGEPIDAVEAERIGLVDQVVEPGQELDEAKNLARKILKNGPIAIRFAKKAINRGLQMSLHDALLMEATLFGELFETDDTTEGVKAFLDKRKPDFTGK
jgi:enoyl-CoA hydratase